MTSCVKLNAVISGDVNILDIDDRVYPILDIDKSRHTILYMLCKDSSHDEPYTGYIVPLNWGNAIDCDSDYGVFYLNPNQVVEASNYLNTLEDATIKSMYDFNAMVEDEVYPIMADDDPEENYEYIHSYLMEIKEFYSETAMK